MRKLLLLVVLAWLIHFIGGGEPLKVEHISKFEVSNKIRSFSRDDDYYGRRAYFSAVKDGKIVIIPWFQVLYIEEVS